MYRIYARRSTGKNYNGKGAAWHTLEAQHEDKETADRIALALVETGGYDCASVKEIPEEPLARGLALS